MAQLPHVAKAVAVVSVVPKTIVKPQNRLSNNVTTEENRAAAYEAAQQLQALPKNASSVRKHNRCSITGRPKGYMRQFGISRIQFREMASAGLIPGVKKASW